MGLPGREHIELSGHRQHIVRHVGAERLNVPVFRAVEAELAIKTVGGDLRWHLQKDHSGEAAAMGVGGVVITGGLAICLLYTSPSPRDMRRSRMPSSA